MKKKNWKMIDMYPEIKDMLSQIKRECPDLRTDTAAIYYSIRFTCEKMVPDYIKIQRERLAQQSPENRVKKEVDMKMEKEKYKGEILATKGRSICEQLEGKIDDKDMCTYETFIFINKNNIQRGSITTPVETLTEENIKTQYKKYDGTNITREEFDELRTSR
jgi:hypothetical protein